MEVGAVKQAFNNEVILLKKKLNQAKIQVIHKLTRKAKTLTEKKPPEHLKEKLKRKAESAVKEVLIIKKIKARDIAKFIITHTGKLNDYLNKPNVDNDKACARLVLHKALQDKYKFFRNSFGNIPIKDLFMSRQERLKLKKEAREEQKNKKKGKKGKNANSSGDWDVQDVKMGDKSSDDERNDVNEHSDEERIARSHGESDQDIADDEDNPSHSLIEQENNANEEIQEESGDDEELQEESGDNEELQEESGDDEELQEEKSADDDDNDDVNTENSENDDEQVGKLIKPESKKAKPAEKTKSPELKPQMNINKFESNFDFLIQNKQTKAKESKVDKKVKENKNKNLKEKMQNRKFKKDDDDEHIEGRKVVDPFFITSTGGNYLSLAEPRQPDEVKEVHKQGNRQERRAAMFGRKFKPRKDFRENNFKSNKFDDSKNSGGKFKNDRFSNGDFNDRNGGFNDKERSFNDRNSKFNDRNNKFNDRNPKFNEKNDRFNNSKFGNSNTVDKKEEKLHPSWEAKRKMKSMSLLPSQGKKIVFNDY